MNPGDVFGPESQPWAVIPFELIKSGRAALPLKGRGILTLVYVYVPFVALPIFVALETLDRRLLEAAADLGASRWQAFRRVTLPLSIPGVIAGFTFVFIPTIGEYFTPLLVGGVVGTRFGNAIADQFGQSLNWTNGSVLSFFLLVVVAILMAVFARFLTVRRLATG